jgi:hypothetical protein
MISRFGKESGPTQDCCASLWELLASHDRMALQKMETGAANRESRVSVLGKQD